MTIEQLQPYKDNTEFLIELVQSINSWDGSLDNLEVHNFDDEFFNTYFEGKPEEAARATFFGNIQSWMDDYIRFNGYGNLESLTGYQYDDELKESATEILEAAIRLQNNINLAEIVSQYSEE